MSEPLYVLLELHPIAIGEVKSGWPIRSYTTKDRALEDLKLLSDLNKARYYSVIEVTHIDA